MRTAWGSAGSLSYGLIARPARQRPTYFFSSSPATCSGFLGSARCQWASLRTSCFSVFYAHFLPTLSSLCHRRATPQIELQVLTMQFRSPSLPLLPHVSPSRYWPRDFQGRSGTVCSSSLTPWFAPALVQDLGRSVVFRDRAGRSTALSDLTWLVVMFALVPFAFATGSDWAVVGCWGAGSVAGAAVALWQLHWRLRSPAVAALWWKSEIWPFGRWLGLQAVLFSLISFVAVLALVSILGARDFGGLVAVQTVLTPLTLLGPAIALPGLPLLSRIIQISPRRALRVAAKLGGLLTFLTAVYVFIVYWFPDTLSIVFGSPFADFRSIIIPVGLGQILAAPAMAFLLFLKAVRAGRALLGLSTLQALLYLALSIALAISGGVDGAAWATAGANLITGLALMTVIYSEMKKS